MDFNGPNYSINLIFHERLLFLSLIHLWNEYIPFWIPERCEWLERLPLKIDFNSFKNSFINMLKKKKRRHCQNFIKSFFLLSINLAFPSIARCVIWCAANFTDFKLIAGVCLKGFKAVEIQCGDTWFVSTFSINFCLFSSLFKIK